MSLGDVDELRDVILGVFLFATIYKNGNVRFQFKGNLEFKEETLVRFLFQDKTVEVD